MSNNCVSIRNPFSASPNSPGFRQRMSMVDKMRKTSLASAYNTSRKLLPYQLYD